MQSQRRRCVAFDGTTDLVRELLINLLADRYERRFTIVTNNLAFSDWVQVVGDEMLTTALLDRLFCRLKRFRRVDTRCDKLDIIFLSAIHLVPIYDMLNSI